MLTATQSTFIYTFSLSRKAPVGSGTHLGIDDRPPLRGHLVGKVAMPCWSAAISCVSPWKQRFQPLTNNGGCQFSKLAGWEIRVGLYVLSWCISHIFPRSRLKFLPGNLRLTRSLPRRAYWNMVSMQVRDPWSVADAFKLQVGTCIPKTSGPSLMWHSRPSLVSSWSCAFMVGEQAL